jgi:hypothetical protein
MALRGLELRLNEDKTRVIDAKKQDLTFLVLPWKSRKTSRQEDGLLWDFTRYPQLLHGLRL